MKKILFPLFAALSMIFAGCSKADAPEPEVTLERACKVGSNNVKLGEMNVSLDNGVYFFWCTAGEVSTFIGEFDKDVVGKTLEMAKSSSNKNYGISLNGMFMLGEKDWINGSDFYSVNTDKGMNSSFTSGTMKVTKQGENFIVEVKGTLKKLDTAFEFKNYFPESEAIDISKR